MSVNLCECQQDRPWNWELYCHCSSLWTSQTPGRCRRIFCRQNRIWYSIVIVFSKYISFGVLYFYRRFSALAGRCSGYTSGFGDSRHRAFVPSAAVKVCCSWCRDLAGNIACIFISWNSAFVHRICYRSKLAVSGDAYGIKPVTWHFSIVCTAGEIMLP